MIKEVKVLCPIVYYNKHHDRDYFDNKGVMIITYLVVISMCLI